MVMRKEPILKEVYSCQSTWVPYAFKNLMIHGMLQFALLIALRYALHRCENQDIHCQESCKGCVRCFDTSTYKNQHTSDYLVSNIYVLFGKITQVYLDSSQGATQNNSNDPSAGSPTDTLLRLLLPLNDAVWGNLEYKCTPPYTSLSHSIGNSDGRCVQRAGT